LDLADSSRAQRIGILRKVEKTTSAKMDFISALILRVPRVDLLEKVYKHH
jgi:hypothetical protein